MDNDIVSVNNQGRKPTRLPLMEEASKLAVRSFMSSNIVDGKKGELLVDDNKFRLTLDGEITADQRAFFDEIRKVVDSQQSDLDRQNQTVRCLMTTYKFSQSNQWTLQKYLQQDDT